MLNTLLGFFWCHVTNVYLYIVRPMLKWFIRKVTGRCELLRIILGEADGSMRVFLVENSLKNSRSKSLKQLLATDNVNVDEAVDNIMRIKSVSEEVHCNFRPVITLCLCQICGYRQLQQEVEILKKTPYNSDNPEHERKLLQLWQHLCPGTRLSARISKQWTEIGFQGDDPMTDFRGMGTLGLENLLFFVTHHGETARRMLSHSNHPSLGYSFAIVGINLSHLVYDLLMRGHLKAHFYNFVQGKPKLEHFHYVYCYIFMEFDKFWFNAKPSSIMEFNIYKEKFRKKLIIQLKNKQTVFKISQPVEYNQQVASAPI